MCRIGNLWNLRILLAASLLLLFAPPLPRPCCPPTSAVTLPSQSTAVDVPILMYHYLTAADTPPTQYYVTQALFERQMNALVAYGYDTVSLQDFVEYRSGKEAPPDRPVILTFDDGDRSVYTIARPVLKERSMQATLFIATAAIGESEDDRKGWMVWDPEIKALYADGFPVESHSVTHPRLTDIPPDQVWHELLDSRLDIEAHLGNQVRFFCYPGGYGFDDPEIRSLVQQAGYQAAVAARPDSIANTATSDIWALPRVAISETYSVELDPKHPERFFMRRLDPGFPLPLISIDSVQFQHADGRSSLCFKPGETVTATVTATNDGAGATSRLAFTLGEDGEYSDPYFNQVVTEDLLPDAAVKTTFYVHLTDDLSLGLHSYVIRFEDKYAVLGFLDTGWKPAFLVTEVCREHYLPVIRR